MIADNIRALGFDLHDVRWVLNSHAHFDHAGGIAALAQMSGAQVAASIARVAKMRCEIMVPVHPEFGDLFAHHARGSDPSRFVDTNACRRYAAAARNRLQQQIANQPLSPHKARTR